MSFFGTEAIRLLRERWGTNVQALAEELYAILQKSIPWSTSAPGTINNPGSGPGLTINQTGAGPALVINPSPTVPPSFPGLPPVPASDFTPTGTSGLPGSDLPPITVGYGPDGGIVLGGTSLSFQAPPVNGVPGTVYNIAGQNPNNNPQPQQGGGGMPGQVVSGSGTTYQCKVWPQGTALPSLTVSVKQLQIADGESVPANTWVIVAKTTNGSYYMQAPVWQNDLT